jgi:hypothetical protein
VGLILPIGALIVAPTSATVFSFSSCVYGASADFQLFGNTLTIVLTNETASDTAVDGHLLSGVMFDLGGTASISSANSVFLNTDSTITEDGSGAVDLLGAVFLANPDVSGEFGYVGDIQSSNPGAFNGAQYGIEANGLEPFGDTTLIGPTDLDWPISPNGPNFGIAGAGTVGLGYLKGKSAVRIHRDLIKAKGTLFGRKFWARGYCVSTVGLDEGRIRAYIREQEDVDKQTDQGELDLLIRT